MYFTVFSFYDLLYYFTYNILKKKTDLIQYFFLLNSLQAKYTKIANANVQTLEKAGAEVLNKEFESFFKIAVEHAQD